MHVSIILEVPVAKVIMDVSRVERELSFYPRTGSHDVMTTLFQVPRIGKPKDGKIFDKFTQSRRLLIDYFIIKMECK